VIRLEVFDGTRSNWLPGMGIGFLAGAAIGATAGGFWRSCTIEWGSLCTATGAVTGATLGLIAGLTIGAAITTDRWEEVPLDRLRMSLTPRRDGFALGLSVRF